MKKKELISSVRDYLDLKEFKLVSNEPGAVSLLLERKKIGIGYTHGVSGLRLPAQIAGYITFPEVENILEPFYKKYGLGYQPFTIFKTSRRFEYLSSIDLYTPDDIHKVGSELRTMIYEDILPFFEEYQNISTVVDHMQTLAKEDISRFICHSPVPRVMVLKKIGCSTDWIDFCVWAVDTYKEMALGANGNHYEGESRLIHDLYEKLKTI
jgi:hypothetical protein